LSNVHVIQHSEVYLNAGLVPRVEEN
jgi:hypothetical protein